MNMMYKLRVLTVLVAKCKQIGPLFLTSATSVLDVATLFAMKN